MAHVRAVKTRPLSPDSIELKSVRMLWRTNSATLGYFPDGAFQEYVRKGGILGAFTNEGELAGYLLFRVSREAAVIVHLCVAEAYRGSGVTHALMEELQKRTSDCRGIRLSCRSDFPANALWPHLGFEPRGERGAREHGRILKLWWRDNGHGDLFSYTNNDLPLTVLDANVFFDLQDPDSTKTREAKALLEDWFQESIKLALSPEIFIEIDRQDNADLRSRRRQFADRFAIVRPNPNQLATILAQLLKVLARRSSPSDESDAKHLAHAIAAGAMYFVTRDNDILRYAERIFDEFGIMVLRPCQLISLTDEELNGLSYQPFRLAGSKLEIVRLKGALLEDQVNHFLSSDQGERKANFLTILREVLSSPGSHFALQIKDAEGRALALIARHTMHAGSVHIPLLRVKRGALAATLAHHLVWASVRDSVGLGRSTIRIDDAYLSQPIQNALAYAGFTYFNGQWQKHNVQGLYNREQLTSHLRSILPDWASEASAFLDVDTTTLSVRGQALLERVLWPIKILDGPLPTFIVPVRPSWAMHLFDEPLAQEDLFGAESHLILNVENVYYRSIRPQYPEAPSRVLWYISDAPGYSRAMHLVGTSHVTHTHVAPAKDLHRRFRRLGVYSWKDVEATAKGNPSSPVLAFTFSHTELFANPVPWSKLKEVIKRVAPIQSPIRISQTAFANLYEIGSRRSQG